jgi:hypothetical protein
MALLRYDPGIYTEGLRKATKTCQDNRSPGRNLNLRPPEYEAGILTARPRCSVWLLLYYVNSLT